MKATGLARKVPVPAAKRQVKTATAEAKSKPTGIED